MLTSLKLLDKKSYFEFLPKGILDQILLELDPKTLAGAYRINKFWKNAIEQLPWENFFKIYLPNIKLPNEDDKREYCYQTFFEYYAKEHKDFKNLILWDAGKSNNLTLFKEHDQTVTLVELVERKEEGLPITMYASDRRHKNFLNHIYCKIVKQRRKKDNVDEEAYDEVGYILLHWAAICDQIEEIKRLVLQNPNSINFPTAEDNSTALLLAVAHQNGLAVKILINLNANPLHVRSDKTSPLFLAAECGFLDIVKELMTTKVELETIFAQDVILDISYVAPEVGLRLVMEEFASKAHVLIARYDNVTPPLIAYLNKHDEIYKMLYQEAEQLQKIVSWIKRNFRNVQVDNLSDAVIVHYYYLEFYIAILKNNNEELLSLINSNKDIDINMKFVNEYTALCVVAEKGFLDTAQLLLSHGANPNVLTASSDSPLSLALQYKHFVIAETLIRATAIETINAANEDGNVALHFAAERGIISLVKSLLAVNPEIKVSNKEGSTPLHFAAAKGDPEIVKALLSAGAEVDPVDENNHTPLHFATMEEHSEVIKILLDAGANIDALNYWKESALDLAVRKGNEAIVTLLIKRGAKLDERAEDGATALIDAVKKGNVTITQLLIDSGANINIADNDGNTPMALAQASDHQELIEILKLTMGNSLVI